MNKHIGCLLGGAVGDALGYPVKLMSNNEIINNFGTNGITEYVLTNNIAKISDATQLSLFTANGLLYAITRGSMRGILGPLECYVVDFYYDWFLTQTKKYPIKKHVTNSWLVNMPEMFSNMSPETSVIYALENCLPLNYDGRNKKIINNKNGYSGIVSIAPVSMLHGYCNYFELAGRIAALLNNDIMSIISSAFLSCLLYEILHKELKLNLKSIILDLRNRIYDILKEYDKNAVEKLSNIIDKAINLSDSDISDTKAIEEIGSGWIAEETLSIAIYCSVKYSDNYEKGIVASVNHSGNSNITGSLTGNILGAYLGQEAIPEKYLTNLQLKDVIIEMAQDLITNCPVSEYSNNNDKKWCSKYIYGQFKI